MNMKSTLLDKEIMMQSFIISS